MVFPCSELILAIHHSWGLMRILAPHALLYTEMQITGAIER